VFNFKAVLPFHLFRWAKLSTVYVTEKKEKNCVIFLHNFLVETSIDRSS